MTLSLPEPEPAAPQGEDIPLNIVFEDAHLLVVDKPAGLVVHPAPGHESGTLVNALIAHCGESLSGIGGVKKPGIVHRIDKDTSGLIVIAKTDAAHAGLSKLFEDHGRNLNLTRDYLAFVWGAPERAQGTVDAPIGRHATQRERMAVVSAARGREAITHWERLEDFGAASLLACRLETGRTHQIRVHMAHIGHPLIGDLTYGAGFKTKVARLSPEARAAVEALGRQALHAATLGFTHPVTGEDSAVRERAAGGFGGACAWRWRSKCRARSTHLPPQGAVHDALHALPEAAPKALGYAGRAKGSWPLATERHRHIADAHAIRPEAVDHRMMGDGAGVGQRDLVAACQSARQPMHEIDARRKSTKALVESDLPEIGALAALKENSHRYRHAVERKSRDCALTPTRHLLRRLTRKTRELAVA